MSLLKRWAWKILQKEISEDYIHRNDLSTYTKWMSRDFPVMSDMQFYIDSCKTSREIVQRVEDHRTKVAVFYFNHPLGTMGTPEVNISICTNQPH